MATSAPLVSVTTSELRACPEVALGIEMQHFRAYAGIAGALQDAATVATDRITQGRIAERELVVAVGMVLMLS